MNTVAIIGNLTRDPELRHTGGGTPVANLRVAVNDRQKRGDEWVDVPYYFDVTVWGKQGENCAQWLSKGNKVGINGKLTWREWEAQDGSKRQTVEIVAAQYGGVDFLTPKNGNGGSSDSDRYVGGGQTNADFTSTPVDDDIPF